MAGTFQIDGLISGLKTQDMIAQLVALERRPVDILRIQVDRAAVRQKSLAAIKTQISSLDGTMKRLIAKGAINAKAAATDQALGSPTVVTATASSDAINGSFKVTVSQLATATRVLSSSPMGQVINRTSTLASAGFRITPVVANSTGGAATFTINGSTMTVNGSTTLDDGTADSLIQKINTSGAGVTASLVADIDGRAQNRMQIVGAAGQQLQLGALSDTSNMLRLLNLADATAQAYTAANVTSGAVASGALNTSITINGVTTNINQNNGGFDAIQNAQAVADAINGNTSNVVSATALGDGTLRLTQKTLGSQQTINISVAGAGTGLTATSTQNGTDRILSTLSLGSTDVGKSLANSRLVTPIAGLAVGGNGSFTVNGTTINYKDTDSIGAIVNRINSSTSGVTAFYDSVQDRIRLSAAQTGARTVSLADTQGNFLAATGLIGASQTMGQNAVYSIDTVNGGQPLTSASNSISGIVPGVTLELKSTSATPVTVTVSQNNQAAIELVREFVARVNQSLDVISAQTAYDAKTKTSQPLSGDSAINQIQQNLRSLVNAPALGLTGEYKNLATIGVSTGSIGSAVGSATRLILDEAKLAAALNTNPQSVEALFSTFSATLSTVSGTGTITAANGTPINQHVNGTYYVKVLDGTGKAEARLVTPDGRVAFTSTGTLVAGQENNTLIPGVKLTVNGVLAVGEDSFTMTVNTRGVGVQLRDTVDGLLKPTGFFKTRETSTQTASDNLTKQIERMELRVSQREASLSKKFAALETSLARLQSQSASLSGSIARLNTQSG
ncbi:MAG: flagellar filament capping protein FliD [Chloroflexota bacterium]